MEMSSTLFVESIVIIFLVALNGFFVATEFALVAIRRSKVDELLTQGKYGARYVKFAVQHLDRYIAGTQVGITLASLALGWLGEPIVARAMEPIFAAFPERLLSPAMIHSISFGIAFLLITILHVVLGELVPKSLALQYPERVALVVGAPMAGIVIILNPLIWSLNGIGNFVLRLMRIERVRDQQNVHSIEELEILVTQSHEAGVLDDTESQILERSFRFGELTARDIMVRRVDMVALDLEEPHDVLLAQAAGSVHSRLPLYTGSLDKIKGILHIRDLFRAYHRGDIGKDLSSFSRPILAVPESIHLDDLLDFFRKQRTQVAVVVDEYGGTAGMVTFEDVVEEVTGEIDSEFEAEEPSIQKLPDGRVLLRGDVRIDEAEAELGGSLGEDEGVDTIAGLIMKRLGRVAKVDDEVQTPTALLKVTDMARMRITRVSALLSPSVETSEAN